MDSRDNHKEEELPSSKILDLAGAEFIHDPYPIYKQLRLNSPVIPVQSGGYLLVRHADIVKILKSSAFGNTPSRFSTLHSKNRNKYPAADMAANILPFMDSPEHDIPRRVITIAYRNRLNPFIEVLLRLAEQYSEKVVKEGICDVVNQIARPFSYISMCRFLGVPDTDGDFLTRLSEHFFYLFAPISDPQKFKEINASLVEFRQYFRDSLKEKISNPGEDMISCLMQTDYQGSKLSEDQLIDTCILLFADGVENVHYGVGNAMMELKAYPEFFLQTTTSIGDANAITAEALRLNSPAQLIPRIALEETHIHGVTVKPGMPVFLSLGSANRDEAEFDAPENFVPNRERGRTLTFGLGAHACIGGSLATLQTSSLIAALAKKNISIKSGQEDIQYIPRFGHRWPRSVPIGY